MPDDTTEADDEWACDRHDIKRLPTGYDRCPYCEEERRIEAEKFEMMARRADPDMHPTVDAPRR